MTILFPILCLFDSLTHKICMIIKIVLIISKGVYKIIEIINWVLMKTGSFFHRNSKYNYNFSRYLYIIYSSNYCKLDWWVGYSSTHGTTRSPPSDSPLSRGLHNGNVLIYYSSKSAEYQKAKHNAIKCDIRIIQETELSSHFMVIRIFLRGNSVHLQFFGFVSVWDSWYGGNGHGILLLAAINVWLIVSVLQITFVYNVLCSAMYAVIELLRFIRLCVGFSTWRFSWKEVRSLPWEIQWFRVDGGCF